MGGCDSICSMVCMVVLWEESVFNQKTIEKKTLERTVDNTVEKRRVLIRLLGAASTFRGH